MDNKLLNLAEQAGMRYKSGVFFFTYEQLQAFFELVLKQREL